MSSQKRRLTLSSLEGRVVPASQLTATLNLADHVLRIEGTAGADNISVRHQNGLVSIDGIPITVFEIDLLGSFEAVAAADVTAVDIQGLAGNDAIFVEDLADGTALNINAGLGQDVSWIHETTTWAPVAYDGGTGVTDYLYVYDIRPGSHSYTLSDGAISGPGISIPYANANTISLYSTNAEPDFFSVASNGAGVNLHLWGYGGNDSYHIGGANGLDSIQGNIFVAGFNDYDAMTVDNTGGSGGTFELGGTSLRTPSGAVVDYSGGLEILRVVGGGRAETFQFVESPATMPLQLDGGGGGDTLEYANNPGLVAWYPGEGSGTDLVGGNHAAEAVGVAYAPGRVGQAFQFGGFESPGFVRVPQSADLEPAAITVEAWVNSTAITESHEYNYILAKGAAEFSGASYALVTSNQSGLWFYVGNGSAFAYSPDPGTGIWDGNWHHVVGTYDGSYLRLYVDGVEVGSGTRLDNVLGYDLPTTNDLYIGTYNGMPGYTFNGLIDEPAVYNRALSAAEVQRNFANGKASRWADGVTVNLAAGTATGLAAINNIQHVIGAGGNDSLTGDGQDNRLSGRGGNDTLVGQAGADSLDGGAGSDRMVGLGGGDTYVFGTASEPETDSVVESLAGSFDTLDFSQLASNDPVFVSLLSATQMALHTNRLVVVPTGGIPTRVDNVIGGAGDDTIVGHDGPNVLDGNGGNDYLHGGNGFDTLYGFTGNDTMLGAGGNDELHGWEGDDQMNGGDGADSIFGAAGNDEASGGAGNDILDGWDGNDTLRGFSGNDTIFGGLGDDFLYGEADADSVFAGPGADQLFGGTGNDLMNGAEGNDYLQGDDGADHLDGFTGEDTLSGGTGNDTVAGGEGNDSLAGNAGADALYGNDGNDTMNGNNGNDWMDGGAGNDSLNGFIGRDTMFGGTDNDVMDGYFGNDQVNGNEGNDTLFGSYDNDSLHGGVGDDWMDGGDGLDTMYGFEGNDSMHGGAANDEMHGWIGDDTMFGGSGHDNLFGGDGHDALNGGTGRDNMVGGDGFDMTSIEEPGDTSGSCEDVDILNVPGGSPQNDSWSCGPNSASRVLRWWGFNKSYEELRAETEEEGDLISRLRLGSRPSTLLEQMRRYRPETQIATRASISSDKETGLDQLLHQVELGKPVIALVHIDHPRYLDFGAGGFVPNTLHWFVVTGFNRGLREIYVMNTDGAPRTYSYDQFWEMWNWRNGGAAGDSLTGTLGTRPRTMLY